jgi:hypothetical protein
MMHFYAFDKQYQRAWRITVTESWYKRHDNGHAVSIGFRVPEDITYSQLHALPNTEVDYQAWNKSDSWNGRGSAIPTKRESQIAKNRRDLKALTMHQLVEELANVIDDPGHSMYKAELEREIASRDPHTSVNDRVSRMKAPFRTWSLLLNHIKGGGRVYYKGPMDVTPSHVDAEVRGNGRKVRVIPLSSDTDPFWADEEHLDRFRRDR